MAASNVKSGFGTLFKKGATTIAEVVSIGGPGIARETIDATHMESPDNAREFIGSLTDSGEVSLTLNFLPGNATQADLLTEIYGGTSDTYTISWADGPTDWSFTAFVTGFEPGAEIDDKLTATATFKLTGKPTFPA